MDSAQLLGTLKRNLDLIKRDTAGISDADALKRIGQGSSLNWVVGHILSSRTRILDVLGVQAGFNHEDIRALYGRETKPDAARDLPLSELLRLLDSTQELIGQGLASVDLDKVIESPFGQQTTAGLVNFFAWHEGYHAGQVVIFRRWLEGAG